MTDRDTTRGNLYCRRLAEVRALPVDLMHKTALRDFVGGGTFEGEFFVFWQDGAPRPTNALIGSYVLWDGEQFKVISKQEFEREWERK